MPIKLPPPVSKVKKKSNSELLREAKAGTISWAAAQAGIQGNGYTATDAAAIVRTAQKIAAPKPVKPKTLSPTQYLTAAKKGTITWAAARAGLIADGLQGPDADVLITTARVPKAPSAPKTLTPTQILDAATKGTLTWDQANTQLQAAGLTSGAAQTLITSAQTPTPQKLTTSEIVTAARAGTITWDEANTQLQAAGLDAQSAATLISTSQVVDDKWVVLDRDGRIKYTPITDTSKPPSNVLRYGPTPLTQSGSVNGQSFISIWKQNYQDYFYAYTGRQASGKEIAGILKSGIGIYGLTNGLAQNKPVSQIVGGAPAKLTPGQSSGLTATPHTASTAPVNFQNSPIYKQQAAGKIQYAKSILGQGWKPNTALIGEAIAQNWDQSTLYAHLRSLPAYLNGPEFKDGVSKKVTLYQSIYGTPTPDALHTVGQAQLAGWTDDEFASYLRAQPQYTKSPEYVSKLLSFGQQLGLITGMQPTLQPGGTTPLNPNKSTKQTVPDSQRLPAPAPVQSPIDYSVAGV